MTTEYNYLTYKMPESSAVTGGAELAQAIADRVFPDEEAKSGQLWSITQEEKTYICGFVKNAAANDTTPSQMYFVTVKANDTAAQQVSCYKCTTGETYDARLESTPESQVGIIIDKDNIYTTIFGFYKSGETWKFAVPAHSFFLEGDHQAFNDLPAGTYDATLLA